MRICKFKLLPIDLTLSQHETEDERHFLVKIFLQTPEKSQYDHFVKWTRSLWKTKRSQSKFSCYFIVLKSFLCCSEKQSRNAFILDARQLEISLARKNSDPFEGSAPNLLFKSVEFGNSCWHFSDIDILVLHLCMKGSNFIVELR